MIKNYTGTKSWKSFLGGLKQKIDIFIGTKNIFILIITHILDKKNTKKIVNYPIWSGKTFNPRIGVTCTLNDHIIESNDKNSLGGYLTYI